MVFIISNLQPVVTVRNAHPGTLEPDRAHTQLEGQSGRSTVHGSIIAGRIVLVRAFSPGKFTGSADERVPA